MSAGLNLWSAKSWALKMKTWSKKKMSWSLWRITAISSVCQQVILKHNGAVVVAFKVWACMMMISLSTWSRLRPTMNCCSSQMWVKFIVWRAMKSQNMVVLLRGSLWSTCLTSIKKKRSKQWSTLKLISVMIRTSYSSLRSKVRSNGLPWLNLAISERMG